MLNRGNTKVDILINTVDDEKYEENGSISVSIVSASGYKTSRSIPATAETQILDNDYSNEGVIVLSNQRVYMKVKSQCFKSWLQQSISLID